MPKGVYERRPGAYDHTRKHGHCLWGQSPTKTYMRWLKMKQRCHNPTDKNYKYYGGRGITVCNQWLEFANFLADMGEAPEGMSLDRIDNNKGYEPGNCRWASHKTQMRNSRAARLITLDGVTRTLGEWIEHLGLPQSCVYARLHKYGWSEERALTEPLDATRWTKAKLRSEQSRKRQSRAVSKEQVP